MNEFKELVGLVGLPVALCLGVIWLIVTGALVPGKVHEAVVQECREWRLWAFSGTELAEQAKAKYVEKLRQARSEE